MKNNFDDVTFSFLLVAKQILHVQYLLGSTQKRGTNSSKSIGGELKMNHGVLYIKD
jgi:hypothetical protein